MMWDAIANQWLWLGAAVFFGILLVLLAVYNVHRSKLRDARSDQHGGWSPTGRIDFAGPTESGPDAIGNFLLQAEDTRIVNSIGGVDHHEIRWRKATLNEAKKVVLAYHAQLNLSATAEGANSAGGNLTKSDPSDQRGDGAPEAKEQG